MAILRFILFSSFCFLASFTNAQKINKQLKLDTVLLVDKKVLTPRDLSNKVLVVNLWGTWCGPCINEVPDLNTLVKEFRSEDILFLAVADPDLDSPENVKIFAKKKPFLFTQMMPQKETIFLKQVGKVVFPTTLIYDKNGKLTKKYNDTLTEDQVTEVRTLLTRLTAEL